jgi:HSP20 family molecular chaperone IbpA
MGIWGAKYYTSILHGVQGGNKLEVQLEVLGIKDKIDVNATTNSVEIIEEQQRKGRKRKKYVDNERSYKSFNITILMTNQKMDNGICCIHGFQKRH